MKRTLLALSGLAVLAPLLALLAEEPAPAPPLSQEAVDFIVLGDSGPIAIRFQVRIGGRPFRAVWDEFLGGLFDQLDSDGNGVLSQRELDRAPRPQFLMQILRGGAGMSPPRDEQTPEAPVSLVADKVTREGLANYYRLSGLEPLVALIQDRSARAEALTDVLFRELDVNKDEKLSKEELNAAAASLRKLDFNDDEMISADELLPAPDGPGNPVQTEMLPKALTDSTSFVVLRPGGPTSRLAYAMLARYDKDENQKLSRTEVNLDKAIFDQLDTDHDGELDAGELAKLLAYLPFQANFVIEFSDSGSRVEPTPTGKGRDQASSLTVSKRSNGVYELNTADTAASLQVGPGAQALFVEMRQSLIAQFQALDAKQAGYLEMKQVERNDFLRSLFPLADRNGDGKLSLDEFTACLDLLGKGAASSIVLNVSDHGRGLFELLNADHDDRLKQRELRSAWTRLAPWDKDHDGTIEREELPRQFAIGVSQGGGDGPALGRQRLAPSAGPGQRAAGKSLGPVWFRRMDRNGDGVVSRREFLGSKQEFDRIDTNGDGLISPEEADQADARLRKQKQKGH